MTLGLFEKIVLADTLLAGSADSVFGYPGPLVALDAWTGVLAFAGQIFFDFAGYSICAIGAALCLGFELKDNFRFPYAAVGFSDFWRRWHISLSTFLRDYLYFPLGGDRRGLARAAANLVIVMFLGGLWHGAAWTFVAWGLLHGTFLVITSEAGAGAVTAAADISVRSALVIAGMETDTNPNIWSHGPDRSMNDQVPSLHPLAGQRAPRAGSLILSSPVSTWPATCCRKVGSDSASMVRSYQPKDFSSITCWVACAKHSSPTNTALLV